MDLNDIDFNDVDRALMDFLQFTTDSNDLEKEMLTDLCAVIDELKKAWIGSDAKNAINNLCDLYSNLATLFDKFQNDLFDINEQFFLLYEHILFSGGSCSQFRVVSKNLKGLVSDKPTYPKDSSSIYYEQEKFNSALTKFNSVTRRFKDLVTKTKICSDSIFKQWLTGMNYENTKSTFSTFLDSLNQYISEIEEISTNLSTVLASKKQLNG